MVSFRGIDNRHPAIVYSLSDFSERNILPKGSLTEKYKAYQDIDKGIYSKNYEASLLF